MTYDKKFISPLISFLCWSILMLLVCFVGVSNVFAYEIVDFKIFQRNQFPASTWFDTTGDPYTAQYFNFNGSQGVPRYVFVSSCTTGYLDIKITKRVNGSIDFVNGYNTGESCTVSSVPSEPAFRYMLVFRINSTTDTGNGNVGVQYNMHVKGDYKTYITFYGVSFGDTNEYANKIDLSQTNQELANVNDKLTEQNETSKGIFGKIKELFSWLTNPEPADISGAADVAGWLPAGPLDSLINLPLTMLNNISSSLNKTCSPLNVNLPYVNKSVEIPCLSTIFNQITGLNSFWTWVGLIGSVLILYRYLINLYNYYDKLTTLQANFISDWGSI